SAARLAPDVCGVPTLIVARTDTEGETLLTADIQQRDTHFITRQRTPEGFYRVRGGVEPCIERARAYAPYADMLWMETKTPDLDEARAFAEGVRSKFPRKPLMYNCSPSFNWRKKLSDAEIGKFNRSLAEMGYK